MEDAIDQKFQIKRRAHQGRYMYFNPYQIHLIRYADDFIITANGHASVGAAHVRQKLRVGEHTISLSRRKVPKMTYTVVCDGDEA